MHPGSAQRKMETMDPRTLPELPRSRDDAVIAGVCHGLARQLFIDPLLVRVAAVVLALASGVGIVLYAGAWAVMPQEGARERLVSRWFPQTAQWTTQRLFSTMLAVCAVACLPLLSSTAWSIGPAVVLCVVIWLAHRSRSRRDEVALPATPPAPGLGHTIPTAAEADFHRAVVAWRARLEQVAHSPHAGPLGVEPVRLEPGATTTPAALSSPQQPPVLAPARPPSGRVAQASSRRHPRRASWLFGLLVIGLMTGAAMLVFALTGPGPRTVRLATGATLAVLAVALLATWAFRLPHPRLAGLIGLLCLVLGVSPVTMADDGRLGARVQDHDYTSVAQLPREPLELTATPAEIRLDDLDLSDQDPRHPARLTVKGTLSLVSLSLPEDAPVAVQYKLTGSSLEVDSDRLPPFATAGDSSGTWPESGPDDKAPRLVVVLELQGSAAEVDHG
ncbi:PspC domain-containing protein [Luteococcus sp. OSA5]|uniref:PspC domain-containing protein n=1 Tax=Luteococcus sp. OSA5 TaxID=3401630 RepID=UPI003B43B6F8